MKPIRTSSSRSPLLLCLLSSSLLGTPFLLRASEANWSAELLREVMESPAANREKKPSDEGFLLKTYQFQHLKVGEPGRAQDALRLLQKLLPEGSALRPDPAANSIHLLSTRSAHAAVWDFISTVDVETAERSVQKNELSPMLQELLQRLESVQQDSSRNAARVEKLQEDLKNRLDKVSEDKGHGNQALLAWALALSLGGASLGLLWVRGRRTGPLSAKSGQRTGKGSPESGQLSPSIPVHELLRQDPLQSQREVQKELMSALNTAAIRMEAWYQDQQKQSEALALAQAQQERRWLETQSKLEHFEAEFCEKGLRRMEAAGERMEQSQMKLEAQVKDLGSQQGRVEALAGELQITVRELDSTRDEMLRLHRELEQKGNQLDQAQGRLVERERELAHQQAKLAALTLLLEDNPFDPSLASAKAESSFADSKPGPGQDAGQATDMLHELNMGETANALPPNEVNILYINYLDKDKESGFQVRILPPDHPETA